MDEKEVNRAKRLIAGFKQRLETQNYSHETIAQYLIQLKFFLEHFRACDVEGLASVTTRDLHQYQTLVSQGQANGKQLDYSTQRSRLSAVKIFFRHLHKQGHILADPAGAVALPKQKRRLPRNVMSNKEIDKILGQPNVDTPRGLRDKTILELLYSTGIRNGELRRLKIPDADFTNGELRINDGKGKKDRVVPLGEIAAAYLQRYIQDGRPRLAALQKEPSQNIFLNRTGGPLSQHGLNKNIIGKYIRTARVPKHITAHAFRHTCATHMLKGRASLRHIQQLLGHKSLETTQLYTHVDITDLKKEHRRCHPREQTK